MQVPLMLYLIRPIENKVSYTHTLIQYSYSDPPLTVMELSSIIVERVSSNMLELGLRVMVVRLTAVSWLPETI